MAGPHPRVAAARSAVTAAVADLPDDALVLVACSGGTDSLALAAAAAFAVPRTGRRAGAVVVDHGLQPGSDEVAHRAAAQCRALGLDPVAVVRVDATGPGGPEAAARTARYAALEAETARLGAAAVLLGHTLDDQAETVLLGLARGSGARALAGMPRVRGVLRRPLLGLTRTDTAAVCAELGLDPWHDPTNRGAPGDPLRSRVRAEVLPVLERVLGPGVAHALARTADQLREDADALDGHAEAALGTALRPGGPVQAGRVVVDVAALEGVPDAVRRRALRRAAVAAGAPAGSLTRTHVLAMDRLLTHWHGQGPVALPGRLVARRACGTLVVGPDDEPADDRTVPPADA